MTLEERLVELLGAIDSVGSRVYPDTAPDNAAFPLIIYQQVGGRDYGYVDGSLPDHEHARMQITIHGRVRRDVKTIAIEVKRRMASDLKAEIYGSRVSRFDDVAKIYTSRQDFGCWFLQ